MRSFLWHDYETFGISPRSDRPAQFAAIRTDAELNEIGAPLMQYCQPAPDYLPDPQSCLITGITPQLCLERGLPEHQFAHEIEQAFSQPGTIGVGYNTIRFDDEFTRFLFWRNLIDPYAREWQNECGRWDVLDLVRTAYALRPDGMVWPTNEQGRVSFKLEHLSAANGLAHEAAHDALSDVRATVALARLIRTNNPRLFDFCLGLHKKDKAAEQINLRAPQPFLHITGQVPVERGCLMVAWPLAQHPTNKNEIIVWDLAHDPSELFALDAATIRQRMFTRTDDLPAGVSRLPIKTIHLNKSPVVISNLNTLSAARAEHWAIDMAAVQRHAALCGAAPDMSARWQAVFERPAQAASDVDADLYGGFIGNADRAVLNRLRGLSPAQLAESQPGFADPRLSDLLFRYRARNFPASLNPAESQQWQALCAARLFDGAGGARTLEALFNEIDTLAETADERGETILGTLYEYAEAIAPARIG
ncbi:MAG: exodeoxyribonuclease I [Hydrogenophilales bacterium RIFOXYD1_FULL_62_11]|nr:MAG: exodeoxyribonuclease I [Hydrogenophilales bacterium RIFOXYD1_FULL_62_11]